MMKLNGPKHYSKYDKNLGLGPTKNGFGGLYFWQRTSRSCHTGIISTIHACAVNLPVQTYNGVDKGGLICTKIIVCTFKGWLDLTKRSIKWTKYIDYWLVISGKSIHMQDVKPIFLFLFESQWLYVTIVHPQAVVKRHVTSQTMCAHLNGYTIKTCKDN